MLSHSAWGDFGAYPMPLTTFFIDENGHWDSEHARLLNNLEAQCKILGILGDGTNESNCSTFSKGLVLPMGSSFHSVTSGSDVTQAVFQASWTENNLDLRLFDPDGIEINPTTAAINMRIDFTDGGTYEQYTIRDPIPGEWVMQVVAVDVPPGGEEYAAFSYSYGSQPPLIDANDAHSDKLDDPVLLDASGPIDRQRQITYPR